MKLAQRVLGYRKFWDEPEIRELIAQSRDFNPPESVDASKSLLIFPTSKQQTWLASSSTRLYCILDDVRRPTPSAVIRK